jgi:N,N-dimethylformamidase
MNDLAAETSTLIGYVDQISVAPGQSMSCMVSCSSPSYEAKLVRLIDKDPEGSAQEFREQLVSSSANGSYAGRVQTIRSGSYVIVEHRATLGFKSGITLQAWIFPTTPGKGVQGVITKCNRSLGVGYGLMLDENGCLFLSVALGCEPAQCVKTQRSVRAGSWYFVAATLNLSAATARLWQWPCSNCKDDPTRAESERTIKSEGFRDSEDCLCIGAFLNERERRPIMSGHFNGKIDRPRLFDRALDAGEIKSLSEGANPAFFGDSLLGDWDFSIGIQSNRVDDRSRHAHHGIAVNMPARGVTGYNWHGEMFSRYQDAPHIYGAIHFHDDDLEDAGWEEDFAFRVAEDLESGIYAVHLTAEDRDFHIPYIVRSRKPGTNTSVLFLAPTFSWQAYTNFNEIDNRFNLESSESSPWLWEDRFIAAHPELGVSLYDLHSDGSTPFYASRLRPNLSGGPSYIYAPLASPHLLAADLSITGWLRANGHAFDVIADDDLHREGRHLLECYRVVITGAHPEYWSAPMLDGLEGFLAGGGNLMYLGGNGLYWVTSVHPTRPVIEVRRVLGTGLTRAPEGELYQSTTGELGGIWRARGRAPQRLLGVGFCAQGGAPGSPYFREKASFDPRVAFIFEGIGPNEPIGNFGLCTGAAAGFEIDHLDCRLGSPENTLLLASSRDHDDSYWHVVEETTIPGIHECGRRSPNIQAHMTYYEHPGGGAVFSTGSIAWSGALSHNRYQNNVARITENVLRKFAQR